MSWLELKVGDRQEPMFAAEKTIQVREFHQGMV